MKPIGDRYPLTHLLTYSLTYSLTHLLTHLLSGERTVSTDLRSKIDPKKIKACSFSPFRIDKRFLLTHSLTYSLTHWLTHLLTHSPTHSLTHLLTCKQRAKDNIVAVETAMDERRKRINE